MARRIVSVYLYDTPEPTRVIWSSASGNSFSALLQRLQDAIVAMPDGLLFSRDSPQVKVQVDGQWCIPEDDEEMPLGPFDVKVSKPTPGVGSSEDFKQGVMKALEPITKACVEALSETRCASKISKDDLQDVRLAYKTILRVEDIENDAFVSHEECWNERYDIQAADGYLKAIKDWVPNRRNVDFIDARSHVLRSAASALNFPISSSNDVVLILRQYRSDPDVGCFLGIEMKRGLSAQGLRQAEIEFYLWGGSSLFPFVQIITDMQTGGAAFYETASTPGGHVIVKQYLNSMDSVRDFVRGLITSIPEDAGQDGPDGTMIIPRSLRNPERKHRQEDTP